jgi:cold-inducible RNA-binding protein
MSKRLHVGNLSCETTKASLTTTFGADGRTVESVSIVMGRDGGKSRGFAFIEMGSADDAQTAITALDGHELDGRALRVNQAEPRKSPFGGTLGGASST